MATKASPKSTATTTPRKRKSDAPAAAADESSHKGTRPAAKKPGGPDVVAEAPPAEAPAPVKAAPKEAVSLIDDDKPAKTAPASKPKILPPISKITAKKPEPVVAHVEPPKPAVVAKPAAAPVVDLISPKQKPEVVDLISETPPPPKPVAAPAPVVAEEQVAEEPAKTDEKIIHIKPPIVVKELALQLGLKPFQLIHELMEMNIFAAINHTIEPEVATRICTKYGFTFEMERREKGAGIHKVETKVVEPPPPPIAEVKVDELKLRPPIITFMGHVDHGKTSLMDYIRKARVAAGEAGGITQHIGAYSIEHNGHSITFLDTPGHAAFTAMRARGANVTDVVVLVIAADDGIMPQTVEALNHAKAAKVPIIVAINKIDMASANVDRVKGQLQERGLAPEDWGGETIVCPVSATKGTGVDHLIEMMLLQAEVLELKANPNAPPRGRVIEAKMEAGRGPTATVIVQTGTLKQGDPFICGNYFGKVKLLVDEFGKTVKAAGPATPVTVLGFSGLPNAGDELVVMENERAAKSLSEERLDAVRNKKLATPQRVTLESLFNSTGDGQPKLLKVIVKADVQGSLEAIVASLNQIESKKIDLEVIHSGVGPISDSDVLLASASNAVLIGFNVKVENVAVTSAKREGVQIKLYSIIYELLDQVKEAMAGLLDPELRETVIGHAEVRAVFDLSRGKVAGCAVTDGRIARNARARVMRGKQPVYDGGLATLRRFTDDVKEVRVGLECGIKLGDFNDYQVGDVIEAYLLEKVPQQL